MERQLPHDEEAEKSVIGSILIDPRCIDNLMVGLRPHHFWDSRLMVIYRRMCQIHDAGQQIDSVVLVDSLRSTGDLEKVGGVPALIEAGKSVPHAGHANYYADIVTKLSAYRDIIQFASEAIDAAYSQDGTPIGIISAMEGRLSSITGIEAANEVRSLGSIANDVVEETRKEIADPANKRGMLMGLPIVDEKFGVILPGELTVVAARAGNGKTTLVTQVGMHASLKGKRFMLCSLEMSQTEITRRLMCSQAEIDQKKVRTKVDADDLAAFENVAVALQDELFEIWSPVSATLADIRATVRSHHKQNPISLLAVDYISLVKPADDEKRLQKRDQIGEVSKGLKRLARELQIPVIALCQLNRDAENKKPGVANLRDSGAIEEDADQVIMLHRPDRRKPNVEFIVAKNRHGPVGDIELFFDGPSTTFTSDLQAF